MVGLNKFAIPAEEDGFTCELHVNPEGATERQVESVKKLKRERDNEKVRESLLALRGEAERGVNLIPAMLKAVKAYATVGEIWGMIREANGYSYDPFDMVARPF